MLCAPGPTKYKGINFVWIEFKKEPVRGHSINILIPGFISKSFIQKRIISLENNMHILLTALLVNAHLKTQYGFPTCLIPLKKNCYWLETEKGLRIQFCDLNQVNQKKGLKSEILNKWGTFFQPWWHFSVSIRLTNHLFVPSVDSVVHLLLFIYGVGMAWRMSIWSKALFV